MMGCSKYRDHPSACSLAHFPTVIFSACVPSRRCGTVFCVLASYKLGGGGVGLRFFFFEGEEVGGQGLGSFEGE